MLQVKICAEWYETGRRSLHARLWLVSEVIRNAKHEGITPDSLLGKAKLPISVESKGS